MSNNKTLALERVILSMRLRVPQHEAMERFHEIINKAELPLSDMSMEEVSQLFKNDNPDWVFDHQAPEFTFHLATGVGKTKLIGCLSLKNVEWINTISLRLVECFSLIPGLD